MIEARNLFKLQSKLSEREKTIPIKTIEKNYVLSWVLIEIAQSVLYNNVCFKGGTALKKIYFPDYRFSEDLDFTLLTKVSIEDLVLLLEEVYKQVFEISNIKLVLKNKEKHLNGYTFFLNFIGPLEADITRGEIKIDFTLNEKLITRPIRKIIVRKYEEYKDIPINVKIQVYSLIEIFVEKYLCVLDKARNEPRDVYDLWYLLSNNAVNSEGILACIKEKGAHKKMTNFNISEILSQKEGNYKMLWSKRLKNHMIHLPYFDKVYRELKKYLRLIR